MSGARETLTLVLPTLSLSTPPSAAQHVAGRSSNRFLAASTPARFANRPTAYTGYGSDAAHGNGLLAARRRRSRLPLRGRHATDRCCVAPTHPARVEVAGNEGGSWPPLGRRNQARRAYEVRIPRPTANARPDAGQVLASSWLFGGGRGGPWELAAPSARAGVTARSAAKGRVSHAPDTLGRRLAGFFAPSLGGHPAAGCLSLPLAFRTRRRPRRR